MRKLINKIFVIAICAIIMFNMVSMINIQSVQAAVKPQGTIDLRKKVLIIPKGKKTAIKKNTLTIVRGSSYQVKVMFGKKTIKSKAKWKSNKPTVVTVSKTGLVTAKKPGIATLRITYKGRRQTLKIKVVASHKHTWKINKKATCATKGKQTCAACGTTETIAKKAHKYETSVWTTTEGRGKAYTVDEIRCSGCDIDMTDWTIEERNIHQSDLDGILNGTSSMDCFYVGYYGVAGVTRYPKYMKVKITETYCEYCGVWKDFRKDFA